MAEQPEDDSPLPSFRPAKRRKFYRKRDDELKSDAPRDSSTTSSAPPSQTLDEMIQEASEPTEEPSTSTSIADLIRQRKAQRKRHGIEFSVSKPWAPSNTAASVDRENGPREEKLKDWGQVGMRFAPQTGQASTEADDKHMTAYIESRLSSRTDPSHLPAPLTPSHDHSPTPTPSSPPSAAASKPPSTAPITRQPASLGKLQEIDLSSTPPAPSPAPKPPTGAGKAPRVRLGRDGKPLPPRQRPRRGSDDVKRDALVEQLLRENRIEMYEGQGQAQARTQAATTREGAGAGANAETMGMSGNDLDADERMAAEFRAEFLEGLQSKRMPAPPVGMKGREEEKLKGPKLGGSRSQRAVLRERELEVQREKERKGRR